MKQLGVLLLPPGGDASPSHPQYPFNIHVGGEREREREEKVE